MSAAFHFVGSFYVVASCFFSSLFDVWVHEIECYLTDTSDTGPMQPILIHHLTPETSLKDNDAKVLKASNTIACQICR